MLPSGWSRCANDRLTNCSAVSAAWFSSTPQRHWNVGAGLRSEGDDAFVFAQGAQLFGTADLGDVGAGGHERQDEFGIVESVLDVGGPGGSALDALGVEPGIEAWPFRSFCRRCASAAPSLRA